MRRGWFQGARVHAGVLTPRRARFDAHYPVNSPDSEIRLSGRDRPGSDRLSCVHARSALFDLYGDHLLARGGWAPISASVGLLGSLGISAPAVRTAVSRMVREGWLVPVERGVRGYAATDRARARLEEAHSRIYRTGAMAWDGRWHIVTVQRPADRNVRARVAQALGYLGYGQLSPDTWIAPRQSPELEDTLASADVGHHGFRAHLQGRPRSLVEEVWDLGALSEAYRRFADSSREARSPSGPEQAFVARTSLVHAWRLFLFTDPGLPAEVLPASWPGREAADVFDRQARELMPAASEWVDHWLSARPA
jgi:phenylacetic acid degradation operon negative regulatory protein